MSPAALSLRDSCGEDTKNGVAELINLNINQRGNLPFYKKEAANQRKKAYSSKDKPYILKKRLNGVFDQNIGLIIQRFPNTQR